MIEVWKKHLDKRDKIGVILKDLLKAFEAINRSLLLVNLDEHGFPTTSLKLMQNYLFNRHQRSLIPANKLRNYYVFFGYFLVTNIHN